MSSKVLVILEDDVDGGEADETIEFGLDGTTYAIDLSDANANRLRGALDGYISKARKTSGRRSSRRDRSKEDLKAVRAWAASNKIELSRRGRIPRTVIDQYHAAGH
jgi:hypothetical protein